MSFTLEGCRIDSTITLPNGSGQFICPDSAYTTGNLGKGWNELDLVPYRLTADAGNSAPASQTYTIAVVVDNEDAGAPGYDVLSILTLNTTLSDAGCTAPTVGSEQIAAPGLGGIDESRYRLVTITQAKNKECVYDYYARLALGSHLFPGSSLHANLANETLGTGGVGSKEVSIPVKEISPQELDKDMSATQGTDHVWDVTKEPSPAEVSFGDVCATDAPQPQDVKITVTWEKQQAVPGGPITVITHIYATNPAARTITINVTDKIYEGADQTTLVDTANTPVGGIDVPANTANYLVLTHTFVSNNAEATMFNDVATATYTDKVTGVAVPGQTEAKASAVVEQSGPELNATAIITDTESISGTGLTFSVAAPSVGSFDSYTAGDETTGPVDWSSGEQSASGSVEFSKTIYLDTKRITTGTLTDTAYLDGSDGFETDSGEKSIDISSTASVKLTINKTIPNFLDAGEKLEVKVHISRGSDPGYSRDETFSFEGSCGAILTCTLSKELTGLVPDNYTVEETETRFYPAGCSDTACSTTDTGLVPEGGSQQNANLAAGEGGVITKCADTVSFNNVPGEDEAAKAQVQKITNPTLASDDPDYNWEFKLKNGGGTVLETVQAGAGAGFVLFSQLLEEGSYTVVETTKTGWDLNSASPNNGTTTTICSFTVDYPEDFGKTFSCTFTNTKRGKAKVVKTVNGAPPSGDQAFTFQLRQGASTTQNGTTLETLIADAGNGGILNFTTLLIPGTTYQLCEIVMPAWQTTLGTFVPDSFIPPDGVAANPNVDNSILCANFTVDPGATKEFTVDNTPPPGGRALTIGFWKNWASCSSSKGKGQKPVLDQTLANAIVIGDTTDGHNTQPGIVISATSGIYAQFGPTYYLVIHGNTATPNSAPDCVKAVRLLDKSTIDTGKKMSSDPAFNLAAQLVAAELNYTAGAGKTGAATTAINQAVLLLGKYKFNGKTHTTISAADAATMNSLAKTLDDYNNNR